jgi:nucleoside-diphosphate-sugar epimerase
MTTDNTLQVVFGTGPLGMATMRELVKMGKQVRMVNRSGKAQVPQRVEVVAGDAYNSDVTRRLTEGAAVVYQCAQPGYTEWEKFPPLQQSIMEGAAANGAVLVVGDNLYMYGHVEGTIREELPYTATTKKGKIRAAMAEAVLAAHQAGTVRATLGRASTFYGAEVRGSALGERFWEPLVKGKGAEVIGNPDLPHTYAVIDDFGKGLAILGNDERAWGQAWIVPHPPTLTTREVVAIAARQLGVAPKINRMGKLMLRIGGLFIPEAREMVEMAYEFENPYLVDHSKFARTFGDFATPHEVAIAQTLAWYQRQLTVDS